jgi:E3 ubiquitin-protein ligase listerin
MLLEIRDVRDNIIVFLRDSGPEAQVSQILGSWCLSAWDIDRGVALTGTSSWNNIVLIRQFESGTAPDSSHSQHHDLSRVILDDVTIAQSLLPFIATAILDPSSTFLALNPLSSVVSSDSATLGHVGTPGHTSRPHVRNTPSGEEQTPLTSRPEDDPESVEDRNARIRVAAIGALKWVFGTLRCRLEIIYT